MGLALVKMIMRIETEFEITIPDEFAEEMKTPQNIVDYLMSRPEFSDK